jgi:hypothetical protein
MFNLSGFHARYDKGHTLFLSETRKGVRHVFGNLAILDPDKNPLIAIEHRLKRA